MLDRLIKQWRMPGRSVSKTSVGPPKSRESAGGGGRVVRGDHAYGDGLKRLIAHTLQLFSSSLLSYMKDMEVRTREALWRACEPQPDTPPARLQQKKVFHVYRSLKSTAGLSELSIVIQLANRLGIIIVHNRRPSTTH
jgi:hypothetical protein